MFPDIANVLRIREALWRHKALGSASIMVGAGFSRNAEAASSTTRPMPGWGEIAESLCHPLYPHDDARKAAALREAAGTSGFLRIAQEYQVAFGISDLNAHIRGLVPDNDYQPGDLHRRLLRLPWADVFSTNWDTLLERASGDVLERNYDVVRTMGDIPASSRPRLVKLHGSFPGHDPFIFTEEDYRTYPRRFAPFVNLVQQSMMETIFCLVGFSGDDPNFLHWSGWVRDSLGPNAPRIYLVGWLELSVHRRRMLEARNVMPVDLAALPKALEWPKPLRQRYASEWFIAALELGKPYGPEAWPSPPAVPPLAPPYLGPLPERSAPEVVPELVDLRVGAPEAEQAAQLRTLYKAWRRNRGLYPGWIVAPEAVREQLWWAIIQSSHLFNKVGQLAVWERVMALGEIAWRLETTLYPFVSDLEAEAFAAMESVDLDKQEVGGEPLPAGENWSDVVTSTERLARALARNGRHELDQAKFNRAIAVLERLSQHLAGAADAAAYERCQWLLATGELSALAERLHAWTPQKGENLQNLRRAGLLAELEEHERAGALLEATLQRIRRNRRRDVDDLVSLSEEAWALMLALAYVDRGLEPRAALSRETPEPFKRWRELAVVNCDAFSDWRSLRRDVEASPPEAPDVERVRGFDLDHVSVRRRFSSGPRKVVLAACRVAMLAEITGIPAAARHRELLGSGLKAAARVLADVEPALACQLAMRLRTTDDTLSAVFSRAQVARLSSPLIQMLKGVALRRLSFGLSRLEGASGSGRADAVDLLSPAFEVLSRLAVRLPVEDLRTLLQEALNYYSHSEIRRRSLWMGRELGNLMSRALESLLPEEIVPVLPDIFALPLPAENGGAEDSRLEDPVSHIPSGFAPTTGISNPRNERWREIVARLLIAASSSSGNRPAAIYRLFRLHRWGLLTEEESRAFAGAIWNPALRDESGLPSDLGVYRWVLLLLPAETPGQSENALARYVVEQARRRGDDVSKRMRAVGEVLQAFHREQRSLNAERDGEDALRELLLEWINQPSASRPARSQIFEESDKAELVVQDAASILSFVPLQEAEAERLRSKVEELESRLDGACLAAPLYPTLAAAFPDWAGDLLNRLRRGLVSDDEEVSRHAVFGLFRWLQAEAPEAGETSAQLDAMVREIGIIIAGRRALVLAAALDLAAWLFRSGAEQRRETIAADCDHGLAALLVEAAYERVGQPFDLPKVRAAASKLAQAMTRAGFGGQGAAGWIAAAVDDPLPEVRHAADS